VIRGRRIVHLLVATRPIGTRRGKTACNRWLDIETGAATTDVIADVTCLQCRKSNQFARKDVMG